MSIPYTSDIWATKPLKHVRIKNSSVIKFSVLLVEGTIFKGGEDMTVWVTDDEKSCTYSGAGKNFNRLSKSLLKYYPGINC